SVFLARENDPAVVGEFERLEGEEGQRILLGRAAVKERASFAALCGCNPKRPRFGELRNERPFEFDSGLANKRDLFAVRRPNWIGVTIPCRREISDLLCCQL